MRGDRRAMIKTADDTERAICAAICRSDGIRAREIGKLLSLDRSTVNHALYHSPLMQELCWQDNDYRWHGIIRHAYPHSGLQEFAGYYALVREFLAMNETEWMNALTQGCTNIGRNLNDTRGLIHSFLDCRTQMLALFRDVADMLGENCLNWEIAFELRLKRSRHVRIYADVLVVTENRVFSLEFKMKDTIDPEEVQQAAKYAPYLEIMFGPDYEVIPVLVLTKAIDMFRFEQLGKEDAVIPVCSGDMLFNVFNEHIGFLRN